MDQREWEEIRARLDAAKAELDDRIDELEAVRDDLEAFSDAYEDAAFERELDAEFTESDAFAPPPRLPAAHDPLGTLPDPLRMVIKAGVSAELIHQLTGWRPPGLSDRC
jgi:hypothetical protein